MSVLSRRDGVAYAAGLVVAASFIYVIHFWSHDGDSSLYAGIASHLTAEPLSRWVAPQWWALWPNSSVTELFIEHPAGVFWLPSAMGRLGLPAAESAYVVGVAASLLVLVGLARLVARVADRSAARAVLILLPWMPVAFIFRVRANHEYPMLVCLVWALVALDGVQRSWKWLLGLAAALVGALVVKGVFALFVVGACGLWLLVDPAQAREEGGTWRLWLALGVSVVAMAATFVAYDAWYTQATGHAFWAAYWHRQVGPMTFASPIAQASVILRHVWFYLKHVAWHAAPWTIVLLWVAYRSLATRSIGTLTSRETRSLIFVCAFVLASFVALSVPSRVAERYTFSAAFLLGATGIVAAVRHWPRIATLVGRADGAIPVLPAIVWTTLVVGRLVLGSG